MCGICGQIDFKHNPSSVVSVAAMADRLESRGPEASGIYAQGHTVLGHRRLKIIDLSERAHQPMVDNQLGLTIVYNGALYNCETLRSTLTKKGYQFFSTGDTEVVMKAYHAWGESCVEHFNGMFAFAIVHRDSGTVFLARDRLGIKPLYYHRTGNTFRFASTLPALLVNDDVDTNIDPVALNYYMTLHAVVPAPRTILAGIKKVPPATTMTITRDGTVREKVFWHLTFGAHPDERAYGFEDWKRLLLDHLRKAVQRRLLSDVPVGVLLSGGLDSSLLIGLLSELGHNDLNTFSIGFERVGNEDGNEFIYSDMIADHFATAHHKLEINTDTVLASMRDCVAAMSEPMVSHDCIGFYLLSKAVANYVKVVQSGQGADEVFGGYHWYPPLLDNQDALGTYVRNFFDAGFEDYRSAVYPPFVQKDYSLKLVSDHFDQANALQGVDKALHLDTTVMLVDDPVKRVDNMTMAWGLEARVPFIDHELVEFAARIPAVYKVGKGGKYILKEAARELIPSEVIDRPKGYFPVPTLKHFKGAAFDFVRDILLSTESKMRLLFNPNYVETVLEAQDRFITPLNGSRLWQLALLEYWLKLNRI